LFPFYSEYVTTEDVQRVCKEIGLRDWSEITDPTVSEEEASAILEIVNTKSLVHLTSGSIRRREARRPYGQVHWRRWLP
jgi:hypothetical protein